MAKPYLIFKAHTGIYYAQIRLADGSFSNNKSTGCRNRTEAEHTVMEWIVTPETFLLVLVLKAARLRVLIRSVYSFYLVVA